MQFREEKKSMTKSQVISEVSKTLVTKVSGELGNTGVCSVLCHPGQEYCPLLSQCSRNSWIKVCKVPCFFLPSCYELFHV